MDRNFTDEHVSTVEHGRGPQDAPEDLLFPVSTFGADWASFEGRVEREHGGSLARDDESGRG